MKRSVKLFGFFLLLSALVFLLNCCNSSTPKNTPEKHIVEIVQMKFQPEVLHVNEGDTVVFINKDLFVHDVTEELHKSWTSKPIASGSSWKMVATQSVDYFCSIHVVMKGKIIVNKVPGK
jgi:plastocyanin